MIDDNRKMKKRVRVAALRYDAERDGVPRLVAQGDGLVAEKIIKIAEEAGIPITRDPDLVTILSKIEVGSFITPQLYEIVAELLVFVYRLKENWQATHDGGFN